jgi:hypothetical protein
MYAKPVYKISHLLAASFKAIFLDATSERYEQNRPCGTWHYQIRDADL